MGRKKLRNITTGKQSQHSTSTYLRQEMKSTKMKTKKISAYGRKKIKELAPIKVNTISNRGDEKVKLFPTIYKKIPKQSVFSSFFLFYLLKKIKCLTWGAMGGRRGKQDGRGEEAGKGAGRTIKNTAHTIPFFTPLFPSSSSYRFSHPLFPFFI